MNPSKCPECKRAPRVYKEYMGYSVFCVDCYDPTPLHGTELSNEGCLIAHADSVPKAIAEWNEQVESFKETA